MANPLQNAMTPELINLNLIMSAEHVTSLRQMAEQWSSDTSLSPYMQGLWETMRRQIDNNVSRDQLTSRLID